ncbi:hypothetical protein PBY51_017997 [Eleginops maclovinus]|uniref:Uncharacterized protein n=1 Tax=Eleginops maclovinus TaxID=56733 RepID=A0AAN7XKS7_ELEMC|nr:hypothetical protein PBY51_017997 [Eleginops maclovinus]
MSFPPAVFNLRGGNSSSVLKATLDTRDRAGVRKPGAPGLSGPLWLEKSDDFLYSRLGLSHNGQHTGRIKGEHRA